MHLAVDTSLPDAPHDTRALTPGPRHLARKLSIFDHLPERPVKKICCIGAGYVVSLLRLLPISPMLAC